MTEELYEENQSGNFCFLIFTPTATRNNKKENPISPYSKRNRVAVTHHTQQLYVDDSAKTLLSRIVWYLMVISLIDELELLCVIIRKDENGRLDRWLMSNIKIKY